MRETYALKSSVTIRRRTYRFGERVISGLAMKRLYRIERNKGSIGSKEQLQKIKEVLLEGQLQPNGNPAELDSNGNWIDWNGESRDVKTNKIITEIAINETKSQAPKEEEVKADSENKSKAEVVKYTKQELLKLKMGKLQDIGDKFDVKDNVKRELVDKIIKAQG